MHMLIAISKSDVDFKPEDVHSEDPAVQTKVTDFVNKVVSARLVERHEQDESNLSDFDNDEDREQFKLEQTEKTYRPPRACKAKQFFKDSKDPRRIPFSKFASSSFVRHPDGTFADPDVQTQYRNCQLCNNMHHCWCTVCMHFHQK